jgi:hypothetical protein
MAGEGKVEYSDDEILACRQVDGSEVIMRALHEPFWDRELRRGTPSAFMPNRISANRPCIYSRTKILSILRQKLESRDRKIHAVAEVNVSAVVDCGRPANQDAQVFLSIAEAPESGDDSHAELLGTERGRKQFKKISRGVANKILKACDTIPTNLWDWHVTGPLRRVGRKLGLWKPKSGDSH